MVQIILAKVVLRQIRDVGQLHVRDIRRPEYANVHFYPVPAFAQYKLLWGVFFPSSFGVRVLFRGEMKCLRYRKRIAANAGTEIARWVRAQWGLGDVR